MAKLAMNVEMKDVSGTPVSVVDIDGIIDGSTVGELEEQFEQLKTQGHVRFLFDFTNLEYISSAGIGFLMKESDAVRENQGTMVLINLTPRVKRIFELLDLLEFFQMGQDEQEGLTKAAS